MIITKTFHHLFLFFIVVGSVYAQQTDNNLNPISEQLDLYQFSYKETDGVNFNDQQNGLSITLKPIKSELYYNYVNLYPNYGDYSNTVSVIKQNYMSNSYSLSTSNSMIINALFKVGYDYSLLNYINNKVYGIKSGNTSVEYLERLGFLNYQINEYRLEGRGMRIWLNLEQENMHVVYTNGEYKLFNPFYHDGRYMSVFSTRIENLSNQPNQICSNNFSIFSDGIIFEPYDIFDAKMDVGQVVSDYYKSLILFDCKIIPPSKSIDTYLVFLPLFLKSEIDINYFNNGSYLEGSIELEREIKLESVNFEYIHEIKTSTDRYNYVRQMQMVDGVYKNVTSTEPIDFEYYHFLIYENEIVFIEEEFYATNQVFENAHILTIAEIEDQIVIYKKDFNNYTFSQNVLELKLTSEYEIFTYLK